MPPHESPRPRPSPALVITNALNQSRGGFVEERTACILGALTAAGYVFTDEAVIERADEVLAQLKGHVAALDHVIEVIGLDREQTAFAFTVLRADGTRGPTARVRLSELSANAAAAITAFEAVSSSPQPATEGPAS